MRESILTYRDATISDALTLRKWDSYEHIIASDPDDEWDWETELDKRVDWRVQWMFLLDGMPLGFVQIIDPENEESHYWGEVGQGFRAIDIWIGPHEFLGKGFTKMMKTAIDFCFSDPKVHSIIIDPLASNVRAIKFYQKIGFKFTENRYFENTLCSVHSLIRSDWNKL